MWQRDVRALSKAEFQNLVDRAMYLYGHPDAPLQPVRPALPTVSDEGVPLTPEQCCQLVWRRGLTYSLAQFEELAAFRHARAQAWLSWDDSQRADAHDLFHTWWRGHATEFVSSLADQQWFDNPSLRNDRALRRAVPPWAIEDKWYQWDSECGARPHDPLPATIGMLPPNLFHASTGPAEITAETLNAMDGIDPLPEVAIPAEWDAAYDDSDDMARLFPPVVASTCVFVCAIFLMAPVATLNPLSFVHSVYVHFSSTRPRPAPTGRATFAAPPLGIGLGPPAARQRPLSL